MSNNFKKEEILNAIKDSGSIVSTIAKRLGVSWHTAKSYIESHEETKKAYEDEKEIILDSAEDVLFDSIIKGKDIQSSKWLLSTKGKSRGYSEKYEIESKVSITERTDLESLSTEELNDKLKEIQEKIESK